MKIKRILATKGRNVITVRPEQTIKDAAATLAKHNIGAVVVVDTAGQPVGILSERDIITRAAEDDDIFARHIADVMTKDMITGMPQDDIYSVARLMTEKRFRHLPIMDEGTLVGIVSIGDILKAQRDTYQGEIDTLETQILADEE